MAKVLTEKTNENKINETIQNKVYKITLNIKIDVKDLGWNNIAL